MVAVCIQIACVYLKVAYQGAALHKSKSMGSSLPLFGGISSESSASHLLHKGLVDALQRFQELLRDGLQLRRNRLAHLRRLLKVLQEHDGDDERGTSPETGSCYPTLLYSLPGEVQTQLRKRIPLTSLLHLHLRFGKNAWVISVGVHGNDTLRISQPKQHGG